MLGERRAAILRLIIEYYIKTGEPIDFQNPVQPFALRCVQRHHSQRNGAPEQPGLPGAAPHQRRPCAGQECLPLLCGSPHGPKALSPYETAKIDERLSVNAGDAQRLLADAADLLADATHCAAFSCALADAGDVIQGVQLIPAGGGRAMLVMLTAGGRIKSSICRLSCPADDGFMAAFYDVMHSTFIDAGSAM